MMYSKIDLSRRLYFLHLFGYWEIYDSDEDESDQNSMRRLKEISKSEVNVWKGRQSPLMIVTFWPLIFA